MVIKTDLLPRNILCPWLCNEGRISEAYHSRNLRLQLHYIDLVVPNSSIGKGVFRPVDLAKETKEGPPDNFAPVKNLTGPVGLVLWVCYIESTALNHLHVDLPPFISAAHPIRYHRALPCRSYQAKQYQTFGVVHNLEIHPYPNLCSTLAETTICF